MRASRYAIVLLPCLGLAILAISHPEWFSPRHGQAKTPMTAAGSANASAPAVRQALEWKCTTAMGPQVSVLNAPRFAIALPTPSDVAQGGGAITLDVLRPDAVQYHIKPGRPGFDVRYAGGVCTFALGNRSFRIDHAKSLAVNGKSYRLSGKKLYISVTASGKVTSSETAAPWFEAASHQCGWAAMRPPEEDIHLVSAIDEETLNPSKFILSARSLTAPGLRAIDCPRFAIALVGPSSLNAGQPSMSSIRHFDIKVSGHGTLSRWDNAVIERYESGVCELTMGGTSMKITDGGRRMQTVRGSIPINGYKKYVTVSPGGAMTLTTDKPAWYAEFDRAPADPPHDQITFARA